MNIQKRVYKYYEQKTNAQQLISGIANISNFKSYWIDENNFVLKHKSPLVIFGIEGTLAEIEEKNKLRIVITTDWTFLMLFVFPAGLMIYGLLKWPVNYEKGILIAFIGFSLSIFLLLFASVVLSNFKKSFKKALMII